MKSVSPCRLSHRVVALILVISLVLGYRFDVSGSVLSVFTDPYIALDGEKVETVILENDAKLRFEAVSQEEAQGYQWQILSPDKKDRWINISDGFTKYLWVTFALVGSMVDESDTAHLRCVVQQNGRATETEPVSVTISWGVPHEEASSAPPALSARKTLPTLHAAAERPTYTIVINYLFDDNSMAFEPYGASVAEGSSLHTEIESPVIVGYDPFRRVGEDYVDASVVKLDLENIRENITVNVIYEPALVEYTVYHHLQNVQDDEYTIDSDLTTKSKALTGSVVGDNVAYTEEQLPGFKALAYEKLAVAADGSTVIEVRYDRNYYLVDFDMNGGWGAEPVYTRYGATVGANTPTRPGYVFDGWELVSFADREPTAEEKALYTLQNGTTVSVPAASLCYKARWITRETTYTMVFWCENANDSGYSYWGYLDQIPALSGTFVDGEDRIGEVEGIDDEAYFTFNAAKTERGVLVEGDGSTVVNVYYTRNYYTLTFRATGECSIPEGHVHTQECREDICGQEHLHTSDCVPKLICQNEEHTAHTAACIRCGKAEHLHGSADCDCTLSEHSHAVACWNNVGSVSYPYRAPSNPQLGQIYQRSGYYYIYLFGSWYRYQGRNVSSGSIVDPACNKQAHQHGTDCSCQKEAHAHTDSCYKDLIHTHGSVCYGYSCGKQEHTHTDSCYRYICGIPSHSHTTTCTNAGRTNTVKTVYAKYGQSIKHIWPVTDDNGVKYDSGQRWSPTESSYYDAVLVFISRMPPDDFTLSLNTANYKTFTMNYYLQTLPGTPSDTTRNEKDYKKDNTVVANYNYITRAEDFFDISGFVQSQSDPAFGSNGQITTNANALTVNFYYDRITDHYLRFNNNGTVLDGQEKYGILYEAPLKEYFFTPPYPENLEPNAYTFGGWYTSPGCFAGTEVNWETLTMPEGDLMLYAKWVPVTHQVRVFLTAELTHQIGQTQTVDHKAVATAPTGAIVNGNYIFQGWFYKDTVGGVEVEKAFTFNGIPVIRDMDIYAKWSSHVPVRYKIFYKISGTETEIASPTTGSTIAGHNKTFNAKAGDQLYEGYQTGYYPEITSHTVTMGVDGDYKYTFYYKFVEAMPYKVRYLDEETGLPLLEDKVVMNNALSVVTETFLRVEHKMPDAYQKRLVLSSDSTDADGDQIYDANVITFYYNTDDEHAYYRVVHYIQNISGDGYREYRSEETTGVIGTRYTVHALTLTGFAYNKDKTTVNGEAVSSQDGAVSTVLSENGALIQLYYDRLSFAYTVRYVDSRTDADLVPAKTEQELFGHQIVEYALNLEEMGYELVSDVAKTVTISANTEHNVIEFLYQEATVSLKYQIIGPAGCGALSQYSENLTAISGTPSGSDPTAKEGFVFLGWFTDAAATEPVPAHWVEEETDKLLPQKTGEIWIGKTYYAAFAALETDLTISTLSTADSDSHQAFLFRIAGKAGTKTQEVDLVITVMGNGSTTVTELPTGDYTVTELTDWSWRYENRTAEREIMLEYTTGKNEMVFDNKRQEILWLDGNATKDNRF